MTEFHRSRGPLRKQGTLFFNIKNGFTLIELMIVVAVIGIVAAIAIPVLQDYVVRTQVSEILILARDDRSRIREAYYFSGAVPADLDTVGVVADAGRSEFMIADVAWNPGAISLTYTLGNLAAGANGTVVWTGTSTGVDLLWDCTPGTFPSKFLPTNCR